MGAWSIWAELSPRRRRWVSAFERTGVSEVQLQPGDLVMLYTDGVVEARGADGEFFGLDRLADFLCREVAAQQPPPETLRRLMRSVLEHQQGELQDDATCLLLQWMTGTERLLDLPAVS
jgi:serine/threonine protein phosphatase PrpC